MKKITIFFVAFLLFTFWIVKTASLVEVLPEFGSLKNPGGKSNFTQWNSGKLLRGEKVSATFTSLDNRLGIIAVRFSTRKKANKDELLFRLKEKNAQKWYYENSYKTEQFQDGQYFPFGFPLIENAINKQFQFEIVSKKGTENNSVAIDTREPMFFATHIYNKSYLFSHKNLLAHFLFSKARQLTISYSILAQSFLYFLPFLILLILNKYYEDHFTKHAIVRKLHRYAKKIKQEKIPQLKNHIDKFFILDQRKLRSLDGLRAWAVIMVMSVHLIAPFSGLADVNKSSLLLEVYYKVFLYFPFIGSIGGAIGVDLFFILSGFLIFVSLSRARHLTFHHFMLQRFRRLFPAHAVVVLPLLFGFSLTGALLNLFFVVDFLKLYSNANVLTWTLSYELVFYIIAILWVILSKKNKFLQSWTFFFVFAIAIYFSEFIFTDMLGNMHIKYLDMNRFIAFFFGIALAKLYNGDRHIWKKLQPVFFKAIIPSLVIISVVRYFWNQIAFYKIWGTFGLKAGFFAVDVGLFFLVGAMLIDKHHFLKRFFSTRILRIIGVVSYSLYLNHLMWGQRIAIGIAERFPDELTRVFLLIPLSFSISFLIAVLLFHYLERPYFVRRGK